MPLISTRASVAYGAGFGKVLGSGVEPDLGVMFPIAMARVGTATPSITFTSIPDTYKHLQIRAIGKSARSTTSSFLITVNGDSGSNYAWHFFWGDGGGSTTSGAEASATFIRVINFIGTATANNFSAEVIDVLDYGSTSKNKTFRIIGGGDSNGAGGVHLQSGVWRNNTNAITSLTFTPSDSENFQPNSQFALYGIKG